MYLLFGEFLCNFNLEDSVYLRFLRDAKKCLSRRPFYVNNWLKRELKQREREEEGFSLTFTRYFDDDRIISSSSSKNTLSANSSRFANYLFAEKKRT